MTPTALEPLVVAGVKDALYADGICGLSGAFAPEFVGRLHDQCLLLHDEASSYEGGRVNRGRNRWYFGVHPQQLSGIVELLSHPWLVAICREVLGPDYQIAEVAFDISWPGSAYQPWHRDFRREIGMDPEGRLTALAFNLPTVGVTDEMGPLEVIHGTHTDTIASDVDGMFPDQAGQARYEQDSRRTPKKPQRGDMSVRTPLAIHRGTPNLSPMVRP
ncbi:MAG TPA: phytanoyl-CoA dioxygenase family protein, partial [Candidatus Saccharimonadales bacterium]|nr:phytanoyl-CoA dioxygenase family protein [Candidatus Saccharimonadales bacterium]